MVYHSESRQFYVVLGWSVSGTQNTHRHPLWCWMHSNFDPNEVLHEVHLKYKIFQIAKTSFYDARQSIDCRVGWPLREAVSRSFHYICTFSSWKWYDHWFFKRTTQFFTINFESFYLSGRIQAILITPSHVWRQQKQMSWEADQNKCQNSKIKIYLRKMFCVHW